MAPGLSRQFAPFFTSHASRRFAVTEGAPLSREATTAAILGAIGLVAVVALALGLAGGRETTETSSAGPTDPADGPAVTELRVEEGMTLLGIRLRPSKYYLRVQFTAGAGCLDLIQSGVSWPLDGEECRSDVPIEGVVAGSGRTASGAAIVLIEHEITSACYEALQPLGAAPRWPLADEACESAVPDVAQGAGASATPTLVPETEYRSEALGIAFRYPAALDSSGGVCKPNEDASQVLLGSNVFLAVSEGANSNLEDAIVGELERIYAREEGREIGRLGGEKAVTLQYRIENSGRAGTITFAAHGGRVYRLGFELRNPAACGGIDPFSIYARVRESLRFLD